MEFAREQYDFVPIRVAPTRDRELTLEAINSCSAENTCRIGMGFLACDCEALEYPSGFMSARHLGRETNSRDASRLTEHKQTRPARPSVAVTRDDSRLIISLLAKSISTWFAASQFIVLFPPPTVSPLQASSSSSSVLKTTPQWSTPPTSFHHLVS